LILTIKPHSTLSSLFTSKILEVDAYSYSDVLFYINSMQPKFFNYAKQQQLNGIDEGYVFLDKNLKEITPDALFIKRVKENDIMHIVPAVTGGGGKRGALLAIMAAAAIFTFGASLAIGAAATSAAAGGGAAGAAAIGAGGLSAGTLATIAGTMQNIAVNIGLAALSAMFAKGPVKQETARENGFFGGLSNTTNSGTPIALHYGMVRVAGQLVSGYIETVNHGKNAIISVNEVLEV
jgi:predicted phage tail protein